MSGRDLVRYLAKKGYQARRGKGSHVILKSGDRMTVVPLDKELDRGTLMAVLEQAGITKEQFIKEWR